MTHCFTICASSNAIKCHARNARGMRNATKSSASCEFGWNVSLLQRPACSQSLKIFRNGFENVSIAGPGLADEVARHGLRFHFVGQVFIAQTQGAGQKECKGFLQASYDCQIRLVIECCCDKGSGLSDWWCGRKRRALRLRFPNYDVLKRDTVRLVYKIVRDHLRGGKLPVAIHAAICCSLWTSIERINYARPGFRSKFLAQRRESRRMIRNSIAKPLMNEVGNRLTVSHE